jgi:hypothetical protein
LADAAVVETNDRDHFWLRSKFFVLSEGYILRLQNAYDTLEAKRRIA